MILKFVYGKEIHIYDLKQDESFTHACQKIRQMFKRLPDQFVLTYRNNEQLELEIDNNEQFDQLINNLQTNAKTIKLYITDVNNRKFIENEQKQEQKMIELNQEKQEEQNLQQERETKNFEQESGKFVDLHQPHPEKQNLLQFEQHNIETQDKREFQQLNSSDEQEHEVQKEVQNYLKNKIENLNFGNQRELDINLLETSDPNEIKNLGQNKHLQKEILSNQEKIKPESIEEVKLIPHEYQDKQLFSHSVDFSAPQKLPFPERKKIFQPYEPKPKVQSQNIRQHKAKCNLCNSYPIIGARYKCVICQDYDLCEKCEEQFSHEHPLLKICFPHQTPITIKVQIPQFAEKETKQPQIVLQKENISDLEIEKRKQRILSMASELSDLLDIEFQQCANFIRQNQQYTKETLTQLLISRKNGNKLMIDKIKKKENQEKGFKVFANIKDVFKGFMSK